MSENTGSSRKRKALSATLAVVTAFTMLLSGTLAFYYHTSVTNRFMDGAKKVVTHDDFIEGVNKDVYVENTGEKDVYVRVKLTESFTLDGKTIVNNMPHIPTTGIDTCKDGTTSSPHDYFSWTMGNNEDHYFLSAKDAKETIGRDLEAKYAATGQYVLENGVAQDFSGKTWSADNIADDGTTGLVRRAPSCTVMTMTEYQQQVEEGTLLPDHFVGWIIDNTVKEPGDTDDVDGNGWAYWSQRVPMNSATGLLLNNVTVNVAGLKASGYDYQIKVDAEAVDENDLDIWIEGKKQDQEGKPVDTDKASKEAIQLLSYAQPLTMEEIDSKIRIAEDDASFSKGALTLYREAKAKVNSYPDLGRKLALRGDLAQERVKKAREADENAYSDSQILLSTAGTGDLIQDMDAGLKSYLIQRFGGNDGNLTKDEALGVWILWAPEMSDMGINKVDIQNLNGITAEYFPNLIQINLGETGITAEAINQLGVISGSTDNQLKAQIEALNLTQCTLGGDVNVTEFLSLKEFNVDKATGITDIGTLPKTIQAISFAGTGYTKKEFDVTGLPDLRLMSLPKSIEKITGLNRLVRLRTLYLCEYNGLGTSIVGKMDFSTCSEIQRLSLSPTEGITEVVLPTDSYAFSGKPGRTSIFSAEDEGSSMGVAWCRMKCIDIHKTSLQNLKLASLPVLQIAIRNENQEFTGWENSSTTKVGKPSYECIVSADGTSAVYKKYERDESSGSLTISECIYNDLPNEVKAMIPEAVRPVPTSEP